MCEAFSEKTKISIRNFVLISLLGASPAAWSSNQRGLVAVSHLLGFPVLTVVLNQIFIAPTIVLFCSRLHAPLLMVSTPTPTLPFLPPAFALPFVVFVPCACCDH